MPFGHPGISTYEYAGVMDLHKHEERAWEEAAQKTSIKRTHRQQTAAEIASEQKSGEPQVMATASEPQQPQRLADESTITHRRRGTFMNHTPRSYESRSSTKLSHRPTSSDDLGHLYAAYRGSSDDNTNTGTNCSLRQSSYDSSAADRCVQLNLNAAADKSAKVHPNPLIMHPLPTVPTPIVLPRQRRSQSLSATSSIKSSQTGLTKRSLRGFLNRNTSLDATFRQSASLEDLMHNTSAFAARLRPEIANSKRRRRQTPYKIPRPLLTDLGRHAPLEPLVLHHRREVTGSNVDPLPPHIDIASDIGEAATLLAINEYFDSQESTLVSSLSIELTSCDRPSPNEKSVHQEEQGSSPIDLHARNNADTFGALMKPGELSPDVPARNPERLSRIHSPLTLKPRHTESASELSIHSDFASAAKGTYSPYDQHLDTVPNVLRRVSASPPKGRSDQVQECSVFSTPGKLAPQIPGHDELANTRLNDFNYFLRMTGPSPTNENQDTLKKKKKGFSTIKGHSRKNKKMTTAGGCSYPASPPTQLPHCAQQMTTSAGTKHLEIKIPTTQNLRPTAPNNNFLAGLATHDRSLTWTEEMLHPLGSDPVERIIQPFDDQSTPAPKSPLRSPKPAAKSPKTVPVDDHPLAVSREEVTRSRKLRDLKKMRERGGEVMGENGSTGVEEKVKRLEKLIVQLAGALACEMGVEAQEVTGAEDVLGVWKERRNRGGMKRIELS